MNWSKVVRKMKRHKACVDSRKQLVNKIREYKDNHKKYAFLDGVKLSP